MTAKEKAKELFDIYESITEMDYVAKQCALIAVDEILNPRSFLINLPLQDIKWWQEVKQEIENL